jgi:uncharacterized protein YfaP (DUF2135 family)
VIAGAASATNTIAIPAAGSETAIGFVDFTSCTPSCGNATCGDDGCGGTCGACNANQQCVSGICVGTGDVRVTLTWNGRQDLDLYVLGPDGAEISYQNRTSPSGGQLDIDANAGCPATPDPSVENVFWPVGSAPNGRYVARVENFSSCNAGNAEFTLTAQFLGQTRTIQGSLAAGQSSAILPFDLTDCVPSCADHACGDDGCGGSCGSCGAGERCVEGVCAGVGDLTFTLRWPTVHDLDIKVVEPDGNVVDYTAPNSASGARLDVDSHSACNNNDGPGVENIFWETGSTPASGRYEFYLSNYDDCGYAPSCSEDIGQCI